MEKKNRAFLIIKHEGIQRGLIGEIISRLERKGLKIIGLKMFCMTEDKVKMLYSNCIDLVFFSEMLEYNANHLVIGMVVEGADGNKAANEVCGKIGVAGTVRGDFALCNARNLLHCSDEDATNQEIRMFFDESEFFNYNSCSEEWMK